jgi:hypothetical protein
MTRALTTPYRRGAETLSLQLAQGADGWANVAPYDFAEYRARYNAEPQDARYVLLVQKGTGGDTLKLDFEFSRSDAMVLTTSLDIPPSTLAGTSFAVPLPPGADKTLRLQRLRQLQGAGANASASNFLIVALLGNIAKLSWVLGCEKDQIRLHMNAVKQQHLLSFAQGPSLDRHGESLRVPRFPAREYSYDAQTVLLFHFNAPVAEGGQVADATANWGRAGHAGMNVGALSGVNGKFGSAFKFPGPGGAGAIVVSTHEDFAVPVNQSFTVEAFVKIEGREDATPRFIICKRGQGAAQTELAAGWSLSAGTFRGIANNVAWEAADGNLQVKIYADMNLADGQFHHLAGTIDRQSQTAHLYVDGQERASIGLGYLGAVANEADLRIGSGPNDTQFYGLIDEVRLSRVARASFHPVLGEGDEEYRQRLSLFERWFLPNPVALLEAINGLVVINGQTPSFTIEEANNQVVMASRNIRILPESLQRGACISSDGSPRAKEADAAGLAVDEPEFDPAWLVEHNNPAQVDYGGQANNHKMQRGTARALDALLGRLPSYPPHLSILRAYDADATDLHGVGRSLLLKHAGFAPEHLGALAHAAGFDFVCHQRTGEVKVSVRKSEPLEINSPQALPLMPDLKEGEQITLTVNPAPPQDAQVRWVLLRCGAGDGSLESQQQGATAILRASAAGNLLVRVEVTRQRRTVTGSRMFRVGFNALAPNGTISGEGLRGVTEEEASGPPTSFFQSKYLVEHDNEAVDYGDNWQNHLMQRATAVALDQLLNVLSQAAPGGTLKIEEAYSTEAEGLQAEGRVLRLTHSTLSTAQLAPLAFASGFDYIKHETGPARLRVSLSQSALIDVIAPLEIKVGESATLRVTPELEQTDQIGGGETLTWSTIPLPHGKLEFASETDPAVVVTGKEPGTLVARAIYVEEGKTDPYEFELRLVQSLDQPSTIISKEQYDIIMNVLNSFHPIGVRVITSNIREHVPEIVRGQLDAFPGYTDPRLQS